MSHIGSVFLGDVQRQRVLSSSTPPTSPLPSQSPPPRGFPTFPEHPSETEEEPPARPVTIEPAQSLELRIRWLEALLYGVRQDALNRKGKEKGIDLKKGETLARRAEEAQAKLDAVVEGNDGLKRFMEHYDQYAQFLSPSFALSGTIPINPPSYENMSPSELEAFLSEMEPEIRSADRDMREIEILEKKGVTGAGKLAGYQALQPRLDALIKAHEEDVKMAHDLERRVAKLMERYASHVDALSELFVDWNDTITEAEIRVTKLEREREEKRRLGFE
ncbi:hypothetical protein GLOTRDRAFT_138305 [Gloeophyllum trabeum ATCC 11539]|uniref:Uncharacterized protein n=1 Tax=Gloeophyllum trabeum (strain ATCC 11539 / FP-39264 / Madison 617) TaxID=670483 RepID=S7Q9M5_GLOTA|nr:uncharacterized protein GLOTRDRAFT_138305 [Gloeophyllum trabeum ATCC 11539]EPQ56626.1 hypothetical protein GLOTRDRAFT_138305 [Gloeophyllum trabeum ATCC 11539]